MESRTVGKGHVTNVRAKGQITIPADVRQAARLEEGDPVEVEIVEDGILLRPMKLIDASQAWFWTPEWQEGERKADAEIAAGPVRTLRERRGVPRGAASAHETARCRHVTALA